MLTVIRFLESNYFLPTKEMLQLSIDQIVFDIDENRKTLAARLRIVSNIIQIEAIITLILVALLALHFDRVLVRPILDIAGYIDRMRERAPVIGIEFDERGDEIGMIQESLVRFHSESLELERLRAEQLESVEREHHVELQKAFDELKCKEQDLVLQTERLGRVNAELEQFVSITSHDLRGPLKNILGLCQLLQIEERLSAGMSRHIDRILGSATRMNALIEDLRSLTRLDQERVVREVRDLGAILGTVFEEHRAALQSRETRIDFPVLPTLDCFPNIVWQLFDNLVRNALRHGARDLVIRISLRVDPQDDSQTIVFTNNREGTEAAGDELLLPFRKGHASPESGTGIGLSIARKAVEMHGGRIWIECPQDGDFSVCFTLKGLSDD
ncbi:MAG: histidine kinase dimerization/phospho-acceptor domain-containing protein [Geminicoccaceae bacterium]